MMLALAISVVSIQAGAMLVVVAFFAHPAPNMRSVFWLRVAPVVLSGLLVGLASAQLGLILAGVSP